VTKFAERQASSSQWCDRPIPDSAHLATSSAASIVSNVSLSVRPLAFFCPFLALPPSKAFCRFAISALPRGFARRAVANVCGGVWHACFSLSLCSVAWGAASVRMVLMANSNGSTRPRAAQGPGHPVANSNENGHFRCRRLMLSRLLTTEIRRCHCRAHHGCHALSGTLPVSLCYSLRCVHRENGKERRKKERTCQLASGCLHVLTLTVRC
jgi:hypothetical protein